MNATLLFPLFFRNSKVILHFPTNINLTVCTFLKSFFWEFMYILYRYLKGVAYNRDVLFFKKWSFWVC